MILRENQIVGPSSGPSRCTGLKIPLRLPRYLQSFCSLFALACPQPCLPLMFPMYLYFRESTPMLAFLRSRSALRLGALALALAASACSPALNWRETTLPGTSLQLLLPCKPDNATKTVPLAGQDLPLTMQGCQAEGATFAVTVVEVGSAERLDPVLMHWQSATLLNMKAALPAGFAMAAAPAAGASAAAVPSPRHEASGAGAASLHAATPPVLVQPWALAGAAAEPAPVRLHAQGHDAQGAVVFSEAVYFAHGTQLFQGVVYSPQPMAEAAKEFFASMHLP